MKISIASEKGLRSYQEDVTLFEQLDGGVLVGVFDGHGGAEVSTLAAKLMRAAFIKALTVVAFEPLTALQSAFNFTVESTRRMNSGSTASVAYITETAAYVVAIGDSPAIVKDATGVLRLSTDHNVRSNKAERIAAENRGGLISGGYLYDPNDWHGSGLQMSRALGDWNLDRVLSREPESYIQPLGPQSWVVLATDGCFDPGHQTQNFIGADAREFDAMVSEENFTAQTLVDSAVKRRTGDNASAILVKVGATG